MTQYKYWCQLLDTKMMHMTTTGPRYAPATQTTSGTYTYILINVISQEAV